jgi:alpha-tubulin suppressor-like RCC1 family protein
MLASPSETRSSVTSVACGGEHTCAIGSDGRVSCTGANGSGQLGSSGPGSFSFRELTTQTALIDPVSLAAGGRHSCALLLNGSVLCWGENGRGELGDGTGILSRPDPAAVAGAAFSVTGGRSHGCAITRPLRGVRCWGDNSLGQLGIPADSIPHFVPLGVPGLQ